MKKLILTVLLVGLSVLTFSQKKAIDSLAGFDYIGAAEHAGHMKSEKEKFHFLEHAKKTYKVSQFDLYQNALNISANGAITKGSGDNSTLQGPQPTGCTNIDFESGNTSGWTVAGDNQIQTTAMGNDPFGGFPKVRPGGNFSLRLNDNNIAGKTTFTASASRVIPVTAANNQFQLHFAFCILNFPHPGNAAALFQVQFFNAANQPLTCPTFTCYYANPPGQFIGMPAGIAQTSAINGINIGNQSYPVTYVPWQTVAMDLSPYNGQNITVRINCNWCIYNYDWGYCYIDADCSQSVPTNTVCPGPLCGPPGMLSYTWVPPSGPVVTTSCITAAAPGTYTCNYTPFATCGSTVKTATYLVTPPPAAGFTSANACASYTFTNTGAVSPAIQTYSFVGPGAPASYTTTNPTSSVFFPTAGTFTVYQTISVGSCVATSSMVVTPPPSPNPAFTTPTYTQCLNGNSFTFNAVTAAGTHTYDFNPTVGSPPTGNANPYGPVSFTAPGTYSVTHTITNGGCTANTTSLILINPQPVPIANNNGPLCTGSNLVLTGTGGGTYAWSGPGGFTSAVQNPTITGATPAATGIYTLTTVVAGCTGSTTTNVTITTPTASAANTGPYCAGATIQLNAPAGTAYNWTGPGGFTSNLQNPTIPAATTGMSGVYDVTVSIGTCSAAATTSVTVNALPTPVPTNTGAYCFGNTIQLNVGAFSTYTWSGPGVFNSNAQNPSITSAAVSNSGVYSVSVTDANGCVNTNSTTVVVNPLPVILVNAPVVCENTTIGLTATGGTAYAWTGPAGFTSNTQNPSIPSALTNMTGNYNVTVTDANGCVNTAVATVSVIALPIPSASTGGPVCDGATLNLNSAGGTSYAWNGPNGFTSSVQNPNIPAVTLNANGVYTVVVTANTCTALATVSATINPLPIPNIVTNSPICEGQGLNLTGSGGTSYSWSGPNNFSSNNQNPSISSSVLNNSGNYILTVTDANGCVNSTNANVLINPLPNASAAGSTICENFNTGLSASGGATYSWSGPNAFTSNAQNPTIVNAPLAASGQYTVIVTSVAGCVSTAYATVIVNPTPIAQVVTNSPICVNNILSLTATGGVSYSWSGPNGFTSAVQNPSVNATTTAFSGNYQVTVTDANGCSATTNTAAVINPLPVPTITSGPNTGCAPLCVEYTVSSIPTVASAIWSLGDGSTVNGAINAGACYHIAGIYTITSVVADQNGCVGAATYTAEVYPKPIADFNHAPIKPIINIDGDVVFTDASYGANVVSWNWFFMNTAQYTSNLQHPTFVYTEAGTYAVALVVKSDKGCIDTIVRPLVVGEDYGIYVPNAFTPNGDGLNEIFQPKGFGIVKYNLKIFDRWGEKIFETGTFEEGWDGTYQGRGDKIIQNGVYTWLIEVTNVFGKAHELKGHVTLIK